MSGRKLAVIVLVLLALLSSLFLSACANKPSTAASQAITTPGSNDKLGFHTTQARGEKKYIVVLTDFPDVKRKYTEKTLSDRDRKSVV